MNDPDAAEPDIGRNESYDDRRRPATDVRPFVGRSSTGITIARDDLIGPIGENGEVGRDL